MTQNGLDIEGEVLAAASFGLPCLASKYGDGVHDPARWILWVHVCCEACPPQVLYCDPCLDEAMTDEALRGCSDCGFTCSPFRRRILRVEPINKGS